MKNMLLLLSMLTTLSFAQFSLTSATLSSSGGTVTGGDFTLVASFGQSSPAGIASGGNFVLESGFIPTISDTMMPPPPPKDMDAPVIASITPPAAVDAGNAVTIATTINDALPLTATLFYRQGGATTFQSVSMDSIGNNGYQAEIPGSAIGRNGVEFFVVAEDTCENESRYPADSSYICQQVNLDSQIGLDLPSGQTENQYRIISFPTTLVNAALPAVLEDDLGEYDNTIWRLFDEAGNEYPDNGRFAAGEAFWILDSQGRQIDCGASRTICSNMTESISLRAGWNLIGNPFAFNISDNQMRFATQTAVPELQAYSGSSWAVANTMAAYTGYAVFSDTADQLIIDPDPGASVPPVALQKPAWQLDIHAQTGNLRDRDNMLAVASEASEDWDAYDRPEPPVIGDYLSVYFPHQGWERVTAKFRRDVRAEFEEGATWELAVETNLTDKIQLTVEKLETLPQDFQAWLVDPVAQVATDLQETPVYEFGAQREGAKQLWVIVGKANFVEKELDALIPIPETFEVLPNYPNPFNPSTTIRYGLPQPDAVSLTVYNILGQEVITLLDKQAKKAGYHQIVWDGKDHSGYTVASGIYIYRVLAGDFSAMRKMILMK